MRPHKLISSVVSCYERHKSAKTMYWARDAFYDTVGTDEVTRSAIDFTSLVPSGNHVMSRLSQYNSSTRPVSYDITSMSSISVYILLVRPSLSVTQSMLFCQPHNDLTRYCQPWMTLMTTNQGIYNSQNYY